MTIPAFIWTAFVIKIQAKTPIYVRLVILITLSLRVSSQFATPARRARVINCELSLSDKVIHITRLSTFGFNISGYSGDWYMIWYIIFATCSSNTSYLMEKSVIILLQKLIWKYILVTKHHLKSIEFKWSGGWSTGMVGWLNASEWDQYLEGWPAMNTKCLVPLPCLTDLILWSTENRSHGSPVLVSPKAQ